MSFNCQKEQSAHQSFTRSRASRRANRTVAKTTSPSLGTAPPLRPVPVPRVTTASPASAQIRTVSRMLHQGRYKLHAVACTNTVSEYGAYVWDQKKSEHGDEQPVKSDDHGKDAERYALHTTFGQDSILYSAAALAR